MFLLATSKWAIEVAYFSDGSKVTSRMGHTATYVPSLGAILVYGGGRTSASTFKPHDDLLSYSIATNEWSVLSSSESPVSFHSSTLLDGDGLLLSFGGYTGVHCFSDELLVYNICEFTVYLIA